jgi:hypothetical protein
MEEKIGVNVSQISSNKLLQFTLVQGISSNDSIRGKQAIQQTSKRTKDDDRAHKQPWNTQIYCTQYTSLQLSTTIPASYVVQWFGIYEYIYTMPEIFPQEVSVLVVCQNDLRYHVSMLKNIYHCNSVPSIVSERKIRFCFFLHHMNITFLHFKPLFFSRSICDYLLSSLEIVDHFSTQL